MAAGCYGSLFVLGEGGVGRGNLNILWLYIGVPKYRGTLVAWLSFETFGDCRPIDLSPDLLPPLVGCRGMSNNWGFECNDDTGYAKGREREVVR